MMPWLAAPCNVGNCSLLQEQELLLEIFKWKEFKWALQAHQVQYKIFMMIEELSRVLLKLNRMNYQQIAVWSVKCTRVVAVCSGRRDKTAVKRLSRLFAPDCSHSPLPPPTMYIVYIQHTFFFFITKCNIQLQTPNSRRRNPNCNDKLRCTLETKQCFTLGLKKAKENLEVQWWIFLTFFSLDNFFSQDNLTYCMTFSHWQTFLNGRLFLTG